MNVEVTKRLLSLHEWHLLSEMNADLPIRILINGVSMMPMIRRNKDYVTIIPARGLPQRGDVALFRDQTNERYVLHRVWKTDAHRILTWGDNCQRPDGWIDEEDLWGVAVCVERSGKKIWFNTGKARTLGILCAPLFHLCSRVRIVVYRIARYLPDPVKAFIKKILRK